MIFGYVRVSSIGQADGTSPEEQERKCRAIAALRAAGPYDFQLFRDDAVSGHIPIGERPAGREMLAAAQKSDVIVASKLDRMFRNTLDALQMLQVFRDRGIQVILADLSSEPVTGEGIGKLVFGLMAMFADFERERINTRTQEGCVAKAQKGGHLGGSAPYGWRVEGAGRTAQLVLDETERVPVDLMLDFTRRGFPPGGILRSLRDKGYRDRQGQPFNHMQLKRIIAYHQGTEHAAGNA
jgi:DNA invertase Pin-like site-specific DNA recombinase